MLLAALVLLLDSDAVPDRMHARGFLYGLVRDHAPDVHDQAESKPFTVGTGHGFLRVTFLDGELYARLSPALYPLAGRTVRLGPSTVGVTAVLQDHHAWAGITTYQRLFPVAPTSDISLHFASPTFFRRLGQNYALPEPTLVFGSLTARWNAFAPIQVPATVTTFLQRLTLRHFQLRTRTGNAHTPVTGVVGRATYHLPNAEEEAPRWLHALANYSFYAGVGAKTTLGFGRAKPYRHHPTTPDTATATRPQ